MAENNLATWSKHRSHISGVWEITSFNIWDREGPERKIISQPNGAHPLARSVITPDGFTSAHNVNREQLEHLKGPPLATATDTHLANILRSISMYCGPLDISEEEDGALVLSIQVVAASDPNRVGGVQQRVLTYWNDEGDSFMLLKPKDDFLDKEGNIVYPELIWRRIEQFKGLQ